MNDTSAVSHSSQANNVSEFTNLCFPKDLSNDFPRYVFLDFLRKSLSLNQCDKLRILLEIPCLSPNQVIELQEAFNREMSDLEKAIKDPFQGELGEKKLHAEKDWAEVVLRWKVLVRRPPLSAFDKHQLLTPEALHILLDAHVIGQTHVTKELAMLVYHQMFAHHVAIESGKSLPKVTNPVLLAGFTGTGKTFTIQKICELAELPFVNINTASMVEEGIVGTSINDIGKEILRKANNNVQRAEHAIVFLDEFDKTMGGSQYGSTVVNQLLRVIEGAELSLAHNRWDNSDFTPKVPFLKTHSMLFILGGAFQNLLEAKQKKSFGFTEQVSDASSNLTWKDLVKLGFPKELAGRINTILTLNQLNEDDYFAILTQSSSSPLSDYIQLVRGYGDEINIPEESLREIARQAANTGLGARALNKIVYSVFKDILYESPNPIVQHFVITREKVLDVVEGDCR